MRRHKTHHKSRSLARSVRKGVTRELGSIGRGVVSGLLDIFLRPSERKRKKS